MKYLNPCMRRVSIYSHQIGVSLREKWVEADKKYRNTKLRNDVHSSYVRRLSLHGCAVKQCCLCKHLSPNKSMNKIKGSAKQRYRSIKDATEDFCC